MLLRFVFFLKRRAPTWCCPLTGLLTGTAHLLVTSSDSHFTLSPWHSSQRVGCHLLSDDGKSGTGALTQGPIRRVNATGNLQLYWASHVTMVTWDTFTQRDRKCKNITSFKPRLDVRHSRAEQNTPFHPEHRFIYFVGFNKKLLHIKLLR